MELLLQILPFLVTVAVLAAGLWGASRFLEQRAGDDGRLVIQVVMLVLTLIGVVIAVLTLPVGEELRGQLLGLVGLVLTAVVAMSSTTFASNAMAGLMLRSVRSFRLGDFVRVGEHFGRVTERNLFHTEIQTEDRDLTTLPNLFLVSNPVTVVHQSGTVVSCEVSLGYDNDHSVITPLLIRGAEAAGLADPFVQIRDLGDFSVVYRVAGFLDEVSHLLSSRSELRTQVLDSLHAGGIEIVSPTFMAQRPMDPAERVIPSAATKKEDARKSEKPAPEEKIFDKADESANLEDLKDQRSALASEIEKTEKRSKKADKADLGEVESELAAKRKQVEELDSAIRKTEEDLENDGKGEKTPTT